MAITITQERPDSADGLALITELDAVLNRHYPPESRHGFRVEQLITQGVAFFIVRVDQQAAGCGGILLVPDPTNDHPYGELKRMYTRPAFRGQGIGRMLIDTLCRHAREQQITRIRLETGIHQHEALRLYEGVGFRRIPPFGPYTNDPLSLCYEKLLD
ncbi:MAG: GNAT family N-acetyltransferase [Roseiflexaceae bacterium]